LSFVVEAELLLDRVMRLGESLEEATPSNRGGHGIISGFGLHILCFFAASIATIKDFIVVEFPSIIKMPMLSLLSYMYLQYV